MTYMRVLWTHDLDDEPVEMLSELDEERREIRKVERFGDGTLTFAGPDRFSGNTMLGETPLPPAGEIILDPQFYPSEIDSATFERAWRTALMAAAA